MIYDCAVVGTGPAGVSAALTLKANDKSFIWLGSRNLSDKIRKAEKIANYPGFYNISGEALNDAFRQQIEKLGIEITEQMVTSILPVGDHYALMAGPDFYEAKTVLLATGAAQPKPLPGEAEYLGRGVSYCATCDGGLYRGKTIAVLCNNPRFEKEVLYLAQLAEKVYLFPAYKVQTAFPDNTEIRYQGVREMRGEDRIGELLLSDGTALPVQGVFCLRDAMALTTLLPDLETETGHIRTDRMMRTNLPGVFAAGDCTGRPYQYTKAAGEGNVAAHSILAYL